MHFKWTFRRVKYLAKPGTHSLVLGWSPNTVISKNSQIRNKDERADIFEQLFLNRNCFLILL